MVREGRGRERERNPELLEGTRGECIVTVREEHTHLRRNYGLRNRENVAWGCFFTPHVFMRVYGFVVVTVCVHACVCVCVYFQVHPSYAYASLYSVEVSIQMTSFHLGAISSSLPEFPVA